MKLLWKAPSLIERDALRARLHGAGIAVEMPERSMSRKISSSTVDLSLDGYSVLFDGFPVYINQDDEPRAREVLAAFQAETAAVDASDLEAGERIWQKFSFAAMFSFFLPGLFLVATYHLVRAVARREPWPGSLGKAIGVGGLFVIGWIWGVFVCLLAIRGVTQALELNRHHLCLSCNSRCVFVLSGSFFVYRFGVLKSFRRACAGNSSPLPWASALYRS